MKQNLRYCLTSAHYAGVLIRPALDIKASGITYEKWVPQTMGDQIWLLGAEVPEGFVLPDYITPLELRPEQELYWRTDGKEGKP